MLTSLFIKDVVLIDQVELHFNKGLNIFTGETGAGKSLLLDSLTFVLGARSDAQMIRQGAQEAVVTVTFDLETFPEAQEVLSSLSLPFEKTLIIRRHLHKERGSRAFVNDQPVTINVLKQLAPIFVDFHGQFDSLRDPQSHLENLDVFAGTVDLRFKVGAAYRAMKESEKRLTSLKAKAEEVQTQEAYLTKSLQEIENLHLHPREEETLSTERKKFVHAALIEKTLKQVGSLIHGQDGISEKYNQIYRFMRRLEEPVLDSLRDITNAFERAEQSLSLLGEITEDFIHQMEGGAEKLEEIDVRLMQIRSVARKYGCDGDGLLDKLSDLQQEINDLRMLGETLRHEEELFRQHKHHYYLQAQKLSSLREEAAKKLTHFINDELPLLRLPNARFQARIKELSENLWGEKGLNEVVFYVAMNRESDLYPLHQVASGGEQSRIKLALKMALAQAGPSPTMVFDEIDQGVGGAVASSIGERLAHLSRTTQTIVITHSPQVASYGHMHWRVLKEDEHHAFVTYLIPLSARERVDEIARMLSGHHITEAARAAAIQLLNTAQGDSFEEVVRGG